MESRYTVPYSKLEAHPKNQFQLSPSAEKHSPFKSLLNEAYDLASFVFLDKEL